MQSLGSSQLILELFYVAPGSEYNATTLNNSQAIINKSVKSLEEGTVEPGYLISILAGSSSISKALVM